MFILIYYSNESCSLHYFTVKILNTNKKLQVIVLLHVCNHYAILFILNLLFKCGDMWCHCVGDANLRPEGVQSIQSPQTEEPNVGLIPTVLGANCITRSPESNSIFMECLLKDNNKTCVTIVLN